jgi:chloramphenicol O-acetyltransferase type A
VKKIDLETYPRRALFDAFIRREVPVYSITCQADVTELLACVRARGIGFFVPFCHLISCAVNAVPEFRQRVIDGEICEFERTDPSTNVLLDDRTFAFCDLRHFDAFADFYADARQRMQAARERPVWDTGEKHQAFFITNLPWLSFTSITHPYSAQYASVPLISIGRFFAQADRWLVPVAVQVNHALVDGIHLGDFFAHLGQSCRKADERLRLAPPG